MVTMVVQFIQMKGIEQQQTALAQREHFKPLNIEWETGIRQTTHRIERKLRLSLMDESFELKTINLKIYLN